MITYTPQLVERLLRNYIDIRINLDLKGVDYTTANPIIDTTVLGDDEPLGRTQSSPDWPYMRKQSAALVKDGKRVARQREDLHCAALDLEVALDRVSREDRWLLVHYLILDKYSLHDLAVRFHLRDIQTARNRVQRAVVRLSRQMENSYEP